MSLTTLFSEKNKYSPIYISILFLLLYGLITLIFHPQMVSGDSMYPTYKGGDLVWSSPVRNTDDIANGDVCVVVLQDIRCIKRLIAGPGDEVIVIDGQIYVNDACNMEFEKIKEPGIIPTNKDGQLPLRLQDDEYLFIGDNRNHSFDSRIYGLASFTDIKYKVLRKLI